MGAAVSFIMHNTELIHRGLKSDGSKQTANSQRWADYKRRTKGHAVPLRHEDDLSDPTKWLINGKPAASEISKFSAKGRRSAGFAKSWAWRLQPQHASVMLPRNRQVIAVDLLELGYLVPFKVTPEIEAMINEVAVLELRTIDDLAEGYSFKATFKAV